MELVVLRRLLAELNPRLAERRIDQVYALPRHHLALVVGSRAAPRLWFSAEPDEPHLYLRTGGHDSPRRPPAFAMAARKWLRGQRLAALRLVDDDRVVELRSAGPGARLVYELMPRRGSAFLVLPDGTVGAVWNPRRGRPDPGDRYRPPARRPRTEATGIDLRTWTRLEALTEERDLVVGLLRTVAAMTGLVAREVAARRDDGMPLRDLVVTELERAVDAPTEPRIYAPAEPNRLRRSPAPRDLILAPYPLRQAADLTETVYPDLETAAATYYATRARLRLVDAVRQAVTGAARSRLARLRRAHERIARSAGDPGDAERLRRRADLLLACPNAPVEDGRAIVPNIYAGGEPVSVDVDPARSVVDNAQRYYRQARRQERRIAHDRARREQLDSQIDRLETIVASADDVADTEGCRRLVNAARDTDLELRVERLRDPEAEAVADGEAEAPGPTPPAADRRRARGRGVRAYRTADGERILVGRSATANDRLTHEIAAREDWWLHARGPGSHVVLRNPERRDEPPEDALLAAASLAAWFSKARQATKVEVHWTRVRDVKRPRGGNAGLALLERHRSVLVEPRSPAELGLAEDA